ncbi:uncharacterized protein J3R85_016608 [Psidium guajava]|nr:uncharacterized protein J3R85_016608 [Psidium guajava]
MKIFHDSTELLVLSRIFILDIFALNKNQIVKVTSFTRKTKQAIKSHSRERL